MKTMLLTMAGVTCVLALLGCQLAGQLDGSPSDEALISELLNALKESFLDQDIDRIMSLFSEDYLHADMPRDQAGYRLFMTALKESGGMDNLEVGIDKAKIVMNDDGTATVSPVRMGMQDNQFTVVKEGNAWLCVGAKNIRQ